MDALKHIVKTGKSIAVASGTPTTPEMKAKMEMVAIELESYENFNEAKADGRLQKDFFNVTTCKEPIERWQGMLDTVEKKVPAIRMMFDDPSLEVGHVIWFHLHEPWLLQMISAHVRVLKAEETFAIYGAGGGREDLSWEEKAELKTCELILARCTSGMRTLQNQIDRRMKDMERSRHILEQRISAMEHKRANAGC